jgi:hypothetical protein
MSIVPEEVEAVIGRHAAALAPDDRAPFTAAVYEQLAAVSVLGPGLLHRICAAAQAQFIDKSVTGSGPRPGGYVAKYSRPNWNLTRRSRMSESWRVE